MVQVGPFLFGVPACRWALRGGLFGIECLCLRMILGNVSFQVSYVYQIQQYPLHCCSLDWLFEFCVRRLQLWSTVSSFMCFDTASWCSVMQATHPIVQVSWWSCASWSRFLMLAGNYWKVTIFWNHVVTLRVGLWLYHQRAQCYYCIFWTTCVR